MNNSDNFYVRFRGRITGPHPAADLKRMASRGQLTRMHELSTDRASWGRAIDMEGLFLAQKATAVVDEEAQLPPEAPVGRIHDPMEDLASAARTRQWFYELDGNEVGPIPEAALRQMVRDGHLRSHARVWTDGIPGWIDLSQSVFGEILPQISNQRPLPGMGNPWPYRAAVVLTFVGLCLPWASASASLPVATASDAPSFSFSATRIGMATDWGLATLAILVLTVVASFLFRLISHPVWRRVFGAIFAIAAITPIIHFMIYLNSHLVDFSFGTEASAHLKMRFGVYLSLAGAGAMVLAAIVTEWAPTYKRRGRSSAARGDKSSHSVHAVWILSLMALVAVMTACLNFVRHLNETGTGS